jgi:hypothetical protein
MQDPVPEVQIINGRVVLAPRARPAAMVWLPRDGQVVAKLPRRKGNTRWLRASVGVRSPRLDDDGRWRLPRNCLVKLVTAAIDRYGYVVVCRDMARLSRCTTACLNATGIECDCSCQGLHHGQNAGGWFERVGGVVVADLGEFTRTAVAYGPRGTSTDTVIYTGELQGRRYRADRAGRRDWPTAAQFMCAACMSTRACVWDHCHTHGFVRAPLCSTCNTRHWKGWQPQQGRAEPSRNLDASYYRWCPQYSEERQGQSCSA